jgi:hypothetical protein
MIFFSESKATWSREHNTAMRQLLYAVDAVFCPLDDDDNEYRKHVLSLKKLLKGNGYLWTQKIILGWIIDALLGSLELPPHCLQ